MKQLSIEEKAKAYDKALEKARQLCAYPTSKPFISDLQDLFPELAESEDERIRKALIQYFKESEKSDEKLISFNGIHTSKAIDWLEKQGEQKSVEYSLEQAAHIFLEALSSTPYNNKPITDAQCVTRELLKFLSDASTYNPDALNEQKPVDKVEPKFKVGEWVIDSQGIVHQIANVIENVTYHTYGYDIVGGGYFNNNTEGVRLWTIQDAKDGDVLTDDETIFIFKSLCDDGSVMTYCDYDADSGESDAFCPLSMNLMCSKITPATKEQRDALMKAMADAGYEWDAEKKELKKIEDEPAWSEEDEELHRKCICAMRASACGFPEEEKFVEQVNNWLKSLKNKVQSKTRKEWSEEDKYKISRLTSYLKRLGNDVYVEWLKSLKERYTWKPSDEQINTLWDVIVYVECCNSNFKGSGSVLENLYNDLKKLREE